MTEMWLDDEITDSYINILGYYLIRRNRTNIDSQGLMAVVFVCVYVKDNLPWKTISYENDMSDTIESICV